MLRPAISVIPVVLAAQDIVSFPSGRLTLSGVLYKPAGSGPFPGVVYDHGSGSDYSKQFEALGPVFTSRGWVFFAPYRRGQGLSESAGRNIGEQIRDAGAREGETAARKTLVSVLETDHLDDQLAALAWLRKAPFVDTRRIAVAGNSFGGIETMLGAERGSYCAAVDSAGAAQTWARSPEVQTLMIRAARKARILVFFFQAENDFDLSLSRILAQTMQETGKKFKLKIFPAFGISKEDGHSFGYFGASTWAGDVFEFLEENCPPAR